MLCSSLDVMLCSSLDQELHTKEHSKTSQKIRIIIPYYVYFSFLGVLKGTEPYILMIFTCDTEH
jgi:hypothetical protein